MRALCAIVFKQSMVMTTTKRTTKTTKENMTSSPVEVFEAFKFCARK